MLLKLLVSKMILPHFHTKLNIVRENRTEQSFSWMVMVTIPITPVINAPVLPDLIEHQ
jgi:hypothetical protein